jgi:hypothetical protein
MVSVAFSLASENRWAICAAVDGQFIAQPPCGPVGIVPQNGDYEVRTTLQNVPAVTNGQHRLQVFIFVVNPAQMGASQVNYSIYSR